MKMSEMS